MTRGYHDQPLLKPPVWTWEIPVYFFIGGLAGAAAAIAAIADVMSLDATIGRDAWRAAAAGGLISPLLLVSDLGRPGRFLHMLRMFKRQSPISVGAWTLAMFSPATLVVVTAHELMPAGSVSMDAIAAAAGVVAALTGLVLATYTGVLIGATVIPIWSRHVRLLPAQFGASSLGAAASTLELLGHRVTALNTIGLMVAAAELLIATQLPRRRMDWGSLLGGAAPLVLRLALIATHAEVFRTVAAAAMIAASLLIRVGWLRAGAQSVSQ